MIRKSVHKITVLAAFLVLAISAHAQYNSEEELKEAANEMFDKEQYVEALPLFSQLLSTYPKDLNYNYKYGACLLFGSSDKKEDALKYLKFATAKSTVNPQALYYMGKAYHFDYQFSAAIVWYNKFKEKGSSGDISRFNVSQDIAACENGAKLLKSLTDIGVLSKKNIRETDFFRSYDLEGIGGKIIVKPDEFKTKLDKKKGESSIIYLGEKRDMVVFSSYGKTGSNGKDIYKVVMNSDGEWSEPELLSSNISSKYDEDYPYLHPNGQILYFASKGFNSMGGYDLFKSTYNASTGQWSEPKNLDFPINTPNDDILYISDINNELAYFASARESKQGELMVYRVAVDAEPVQNSVVKGFFLAEANPGMKDATITIKDTESERRYGVYKTHNVTGEYMLMFPSNGGKFKILVETTSDAPIHAATIELPELDGFRALKQELRLVGEGDAEKLVVKNLFDESDEFELDDPLVVQNILKQKAKLNVNTTEAEVKAGKSNIVASNETEDSKFAGMTDEQMVNETENTANRLKEQTEESKAQANAAYKEAADASQKAKELYAESEELTKEANVAPTQEEKQQKLAAAETKKLEAAEYVNKTVAALNMAKNLDNEVVERSTDLAKIESLTEKVNAGVDGGNREAAEDAAEELDELASASYHQESAINNEKDLNEERLATSKKAYTTARNKATELRNREYEIQGDIDKLEEKKANTKKKSEIEDIDQQIASLKIDLEDNEYALDQAIVKEADAKKAYDQDKNEVETASNVMATIENNATPGTEMDETSKLQIENDVNYFEKEGLVGLYAQEEQVLVSTNETPETYNIADHKDEYSIINDEGEIEDYNTDYSVKLAEADDITDPIEKAEAMAEVNKDWIASIDEEIELRQNQKNAATSESEKDGYDVMINSLKTLKETKQQELAGNELIANTNSNESSSSETASNETNSNETSSNESSSNESSSNVVSSTPVDLLSEDGSVVNYNDIYTEQLENASEEDTYEAYKERAGIHENWVKTTEDEIEYQNNRLATADPSEKSDIENRIAILENTKMEQLEYVAIYNMQAERMEPSNVTASNETTSNESESNETASNETASNETESNETASNETASNETESNETASNETASNETASNETSSNETENNETASNETESNETASNETSSNETASNETASNESATPAIPTYEYSPAKLNAPEDDFSNLKYYEGYEYQSDGSNTSIAGVGAMKDEARELKNESDIKLNEASNESNDEKRAALVAESDRLMAESQEKQAEIAAAYEEANRNEYKNNSAVLEELKNNNSSEFENNALLTEMYTEEASNYYSEAQAEREKAINASNFTVKEMALQKAYELEMKAIEKQVLAINAMSPSNTEELYANAENTTSNETESNESSTARTNNNETESNETSSNETESNETSSNETASNETASNETESNETASNETESNETSSNEAVSNETENTNTTNLVADESDELTETDKQIVQNLSANELNEITSSEEFQNYSELKQQKRRLVKEAEVEYAEAAIYEQDAKDQEQLGKTLEAMAAGAETEEDKQKKLGQIEKLKTMIAENETKAAELKASAAGKEEQAKMADEESSAILSGVDGTTANNMVAVEKVASFDEELLAEVASNENTNESSTARTNNNETESNENASNETASNETASNETASNETESNETTSNETASNETESNETASNETTSNETSSNETESNETASNETTSNETESNESSSNETSSNETASNETNSNAGTTSLENIDEVPEVLNESIFVMESPNRAVYSNSKPIPKAEKLPEGLVFKVQIGAFRNPIPQNHFKGFAPIMAEDAGNGITRYTAGLFKGFNMANEAKNSIRSIGYSDAFVVAFLNGKRISVAEARNMLGSDDATAGNFNVTNNNETSSNETSSNESSSNETSTNNNTTAEQPIDTEEVNDGVSTDVRNVEGVFYAVQVGVYSRPVTAGQLSNVSPLNSERLQNGLIRYTSGRYTNLNDANAAKDRIRSQGISDAFVVAYNGGRKITVAQATELLNGGGETTTPETSTPEVTEPEVTEPETTEPETTEPEVTEPETTEPEVTEPETTEPETTEPETTDPEVTEPEITEPETTTPETTEAPVIEYKVQLGEYEEDVPVEDAAMFLQLTGRGVKNYEKDNKTIYTIGSFPDYQSALDLQIEMKEMGIKDPKTIAFKDGESIEVEEALEIQKNNQ